MTKQIVTVLGAGLAGSLAAIYLARRGFEVCVLERRDDPRRSNYQGGRSINLALANRGIRALAGVGLYKEVKDLCIEMRGRMLHEPGKEPALQPYGQTEQEVIFSISRSGLNHLLLDAAQGHGVDVRFGSRITGVDLYEGTVTLERDGDEELYKGGPLIAADGAGSVIRRAMASHPGCSSHEDYSEAAYKELTIPPGDDGGFRIDPNALHIWPRTGFMLIALPNLDRSFTVTLFLNREGSPSFADLEDPANLRPFFEKYFASALDHLPNLEADFAENPVGRLVTVRCQPWHVNDRAVLIGDAAHAIVPFHGQGMNCAFEDCFELDRCFDEVGNNFGKVFERFEQRRRPNANAIADMAIENYEEMRAAVRNPRFHLKKQLAFELERRHPGLFIPRYSLVMFHHVPYSEAQRRGVIQQEILEALLAPEASDLSAVDYQKADAMISDRLGAQAA